MRTLLTAAIACSLFATGCPGFVPDDVPRPPTYDDSCAASDQFYYELAAETRDMSEDGAISSDPSVALAAAEAELDERGVDVQAKADGFEDWGRFTTTFPSTVYVSTKYADLDDGGKAATLWHELVHVREYDRHTPKKFFFIYSYAEGRWALEVQAYRESFRAWRSFGEPEESIRERMILMAEKLFEDYQIGDDGTGVGMPRQCAVSRAVEIWTQDSR